VVSSTSTAIDDIDEASKSIKKIKLAIGVASDLSKAKLSGFVAMTTFAGYAATGAPLLSAGGVIDTSAILATGGVFLCSASANALNQVYECDRDAVMERTKRRPLPSGKCSKNMALGLALTSGVCGIGALALTGSGTAAQLGAGNIALYAGIYTPLKQRSEFNTWVGALVGGIPPLIGWAAAGESLYASDPWLLATLLYLWQFPHFFALAWRYKADYTRGNYKMVAVNDPTGLRTARLVSNYAIYATALPPIAIALGAQGSMFALEGFALNALLLHAANHFHRDRSKANATRIFRVTLLYLPLLLLAFLLHSKRLHSAHDDDSNSTLEKHWWTLRHVLDPIRDLGRDLCVHELFFLQRRDTPQPSLCPFHLKSSSTKIENQTKEPSSDNITENLCDSEFLNNKSKSTSEEG